MNTFMVVVMNVFVERFLKLREGFKPLAIITFGLYSVGDF
ncbi:hypothetical protein CF65_00633 [Aggregatibacter actinomycetemcomitans HK1651]|nr:hypothetical protein CF65_00633 [Aggregatibacter actinomycetemcomitans HK1651]